MCPTMQEDYIEQANAVDGAFNGQPQRKYDPFSNTYNSGLRDHLNLRYGNLPQQGNQGWQFHPHGFQPRLLNSRVESLKTSKMGKIRLKSGEISKIRWNHKFRTVFTISTKKNIYRLPVLHISISYNYYTVHTTYNIYPNRFLSVSFFSRHQHFNNFLFSLHSSSTVLSFFFSHHQQHPF